MFRLVFKEHISLGEFFSLYFYSFFIFRPLYEAGIVMQNYQEAKASDQIVRELLELGHDDMVSYGDASLERISDVAFEDVSFGYTDEHTILNKISRQAFK